MGFRSRRQEVEVWGDGVIVSESMLIHHPHENGRAAFLDFSTLRPVFSAFSGAAFSGSVWTVSQNHAKHVRFRKRAFSCGQPLI